MRPFIEVKLRAIRLLCPEQKQNYGGVTVYAGRHGGVRAGAEAGPAGDPSFY